VKMKIKIQTRSRHEVVPILRRILDDMNAPYFWFRNQETLKSRELLNQELSKAKDMQDQERLKFIDSQRSGITEIQQIKLKEIEEFQKNMPKGFTPPPMPIDLNYYKPVNDDNDDE